MTTPINNAVRLLNNLRGLAATWLITGGSSAAMAGTPSVILEPTATAAVPALTPLMLALSGTLLAVIALRALRRHSVARRVIPVTVLAVGVGVASFHQMPTQAVNPGLVFSVDAAECRLNEVVIKIVDPSEMTREPETESDNTIDNTCPVDLTITEYVNFPCSGELFNDNGSPVGTVIPAGEDRPIAFCDLSNEMVLDELPDIG